MSTWPLAEFAILVGPDGRMISCVDTTNVTCLFITLRLSPSPTMPPQVVSSSDSESDGGQLAPAPVPQKSRRQHDGLSGNQTLPTRTRTTATRKPSEKVSVTGEMDFHSPFSGLLPSHTDKENFAAAKARLEAQEKSLLRLRKKVATLAAPLTGIRLLLPYSMSVYNLDQNDAARGDDEYESEERDFDGLNLRFMSSVVRPPTRNSFIPDLCVD